MWGGTKADFFSSDLSIYWLGTRFILFCSLVPVFFLKWIFFTKSYVFIIVTDTFYFLQ